MSPSRVALITGANRKDGLGYTVARQLSLQHNFIVLLGSRSLSSSLDETVKQLETDGAKHGVFPLQIDVASAESIQKAAKEVEERFGKLDVSVFFDLAVNIFGYQCHDDGACAIYCIGSGEQRCRGHIVLPCRTSQGVSQTPIKTYGPHKERFRRCFCCQYLWSR